jgi:ferredoxin
MQTITKKELSNWLNGLMKKMRVIAPTQVGELVLFEPVKNTEEIAFDYTNTTLSPKSWFFPSTDSLFTIARDDHNAIVPAADIQDSVIFGIRPCDARSLTLLDFPFYMEPADAVYAERRAKTALIGLACTTSQPQCFCESMGGAPDAEDEVDILLTPVGDEYAVKVVTEKGKALIASARLKDSNVKIPARTAQKKVPAEKIAETLNNVFNNPYWELLADRCLHCNTCSYVCPTCYCFDIRDIFTDGDIERIRTWESCQSPGFTKIAGGYDPRPSKGTKLRQRFCHKLLYFAEQYGEVACVGCGRCVAACPVNIDIREVISDVRERGGKLDSART